MSSLSVGLALDSQLGSLLPSYPFYYLLKPSGIQLKTLRFFSPLNVSNSALKLEALLSNSQREQREAVQRETLQARGNIEKMFLF